MFHSKADIYDKGATEFENFKKLLEDIIKKSWYAVILFHNLPKTPLVSMS